MCSINNNSRKLPRWILIYIDLSFSSSVVQRLKWKIKCCISTSFCTLMPTDTQEQLILLKEFLHLQDSTMRSSIRNIWRESITSSAILNSNKQSCIQYNGPACFISCFNLLFVLCLNYLIYSFLSFITHNTWTVWYILDLDTAFIQPPLSHQCLSHYCN